MKNLRNSFMELGIPESRILENESMAKHISFRVGGCADYYVNCTDRKELSSLLSFLTEEGVPHMLIGNGSNLLFRDSGYRGVIIHLEGEFQDCEVQGDTVIAGSGKLLSSVSSLAAKSGLAGMEFASGIPGSIGGAIYMNAGAYGGEMKDIVTRVWLMSPDGKEETVRTGTEMEFAYRNSCLQRTGEIVTKVELKLQPEDAEAIQARIAELTEKRVQKQPVNFPSAGSTFKRPAEGYAAALIQESGLKGVSVGGAEVSEKHSGFIINKGGATATDVLQLMELVEKKVYEDSGIHLEPEVRIIGEEDE
ncbi:MAG: UDP-N-acetylmuramate dehydrogenase [Clostridia bacterium]|nr:UDP-N-acetylmuramate dehydrogenase [Clostridia bacterium]